MGATPRTGGARSGVLGRHAARRLSRSTPRLLEPPLLARATQGSWTATLAPTSPTAGTAKTPQGEWTSPSATPTPWAQQREDTALATSLATTRTSALASLENKRARTSSPREVRGSATTLH